MSKLLSKDQIDFLETRGNIYQGQYFYKGLKRPRIRFVICYFSEDYLINLKKELGWGSIYHSKGAKTYMYTIAGAEDVYDFLVTMKKYLSADRMTALYVSYEIYLNQVKETSYYYANRG